MRVELLTEFQSGSSGAAGQTKTLFPKWAITVKIRGSSFSRVWSRGRCLQHDKKRQTWALRLRWRLFQPARRGGSVGFDDAHLEKQRIGAWVSES